MEENKKYVRRGIYRLVTALSLGVAAFAVEHTAALSAIQLLFIYLVPYLVAGYDVLEEALEGLVKGEALDECVLMSVATIGAFAIGFMPGAEPQFAEAVAVMVFFQAGELLEHIAEERSERSLKAITAIRPDIAVVIREGRQLTVSPSDVKVGELILVTAGQRVPLDGVIKEGITSVNTSAVTGESVPRSLHPGDSILSGFVNIDGTVEVRVDRPFEESTVARMLAMVKEAAERKSRSENLITRFARVYTPIVVLLAFLTALLPPLFSGSFAESFPTWLYRSLTFLVVSCPCALVISVPLTFFAGLGNAARKGILIKGSCFIESLSRVRTVAFDKTGTLTEGVFDVTAAHPDKISKEMLLRFAALVEHYSSHPIASALKSAWHGDAAECHVSNVSETAGKGLCADVDGRRVCVGNSSLMESMGVQWRPCHCHGTLVHVAVDGEYAGHIVVADRMRLNTPESIASLYSAGIRKTVMLTGDKGEVASEIALAAGISEYHADLLPQDKVSVMESLMSNGNRDSVAFVGDGINDAPVLTRADVGVAMGAMGSDSAVEAADVVIMDDDLGKVVSAVQCSRRTMSIAWQNIVFAIGVKVAVLLLAFLGVATMWMAIFADVGVTVLAIMNAMRAMRSV